MARASEEVPQEMIMEEGEWYNPSLRILNNFPESELASDRLGSFFFSPLKKDQSVDAGTDIEVIQEIQENRDLVDPIAAMLISSNDDDFDTINVVETKSSNRVWQNVREQVFAVTNDVLQESTNQYAASVVDGVEMSRGVVGAIADGAKSFWSFLTQPVWVPGKKNEPIQYSRGALFFLDIVRFGGTFASLFVVLFVSLNFQSFYAIAHSYIEPLSDVTAGKKLASDLDPGLAEKLKKIPSLATAGANSGDMTAYLPEVGPPDNRLIVPKMNLNIPIVVPPNTNLMKEDWKGLEEDIQQGLQDGVVHYPGTARPGQAGNFFVTGHSSYYPWAPGKYKSVFAQLSVLNVGDEYWVYYGGDKYRYIVTEKKEINPSDVTVLDQPISKRISTLMTCTPVGTTLRRLIITAQEVDPVTGQPMTVGEHAHENATPTTKMDMLPI